LISLHSHFKLHIQFAKSLQVSSGEKKRKKGNETDKTLDNAEKKCDYAIAQSGFPPLAVLVAYKTVAKSPAHTTPVAQR
jgi:hypothetical protein